MSFLAVDGEAENGRYSLLCDSDHRHVYKRGGLSTRECFDFLLSGRLKVIACFGLNYDANNWLKDLPGYRLHELWTTGKAIYVVGARRYRLEWIPGKWFRVGLGKQSVQVCEVWGYFQSTFVKACQKWNLDIQPELEIMKRKRGTFTRKELPRVIAYCFYECELLSKLMEKIREQCERLEITPRQWIGAGSLASALMHKHGVRRHVRHDPEISEGDGLTAILRAYFGGRVEMFRQGDFTDVCTYDINSAYPAGAVSLPSLAGAKLVPVKRYKPETEHAIWEVEWNCKPGSVLTPFPARVKREIYYPLRGSGCYHAREVRAALAAGFPIKILRGWRLEIANDSKPFAWIPDVYAERARLKRINDHGEKVLKLGLNSVYGKLAQGKGRHGKNPAWQSYFWAGSITAYCRSRILTMAAEQTPLMISTDGVFFDSPLPNPEPDSTKLGGLSHGFLAELWIGQPGVYWGRDSEGNEIIRSRGFFARDIDYENLRNGFQEYGSDYVHTYDSNRFIGLGVALQRNDPEQWLSWRDEKRQIVLRPTRRNLNGYTMDGLAPILLPFEGPMISETYTPKGGTIANREVPEDFQQGLDQPLRTE